MIRLQLSNVLYTVGTSGARNLHLPSRKQWESNMKSIIIDAAQSDAHPRDVAGLPRLG